MTETAERTMTLSEYAAHRGVTPEAVRYAIRVGKITQGVVKKEGKVPKLLASIADREWVLERRTPGEAQAESGSSGGTPYVADSRARREAADAELAELKLEREKGKLVDAEETQKAAFKAARITRDAMLNIPDRVAAELAAETNQFKIHERLTMEIKRALEGLKVEE